MKAPTPDDEGGYAIPASFIEGIRPMYEDVPFWLSMLPRTPPVPLSRRQRARAWLRDRRERVSIAADALRGRHHCGDDW